MPHLLLCSILLSTLASAELTMPVRAQPGELDKALAQLRETRANGNTTTATLLLSTGTHQTATTLDASIVGEGLTIKAADPAAPAPVLSAGTTLTDWAVGKDRWTTKLDTEPASLYANGEPCTLARDPNSGFWRIEQTGPDRRTSFTWQENTIPTVKDLSHLQLVFLHDWSSTHVGVKSLDPPSRTLTTQLPIGPKADHYRIDHFEKQPRFFLQGSRDFLDAPGEWHYDRPTKQLTYRPRPGETPESTRLIATTRPHALLVRGTPDQPVRNLRFEHIVFSHAQWQPSGNRFAGGQASFHESGESFTRTPVPCSVEVTHGTNLSFESCQFLNSSTGGLWIGEACSQVSIRKSTFRNLGANGLMIGIPGNPRSVTEHITVEHCTISHCGQRYPGSVGLWIGIAAHCSVRNNHIHTLPYTGLSLGWRWSATPSASRDHLVENNHIHHILLTLSDGGGIYTLGLQPNSILRGNHIHDVRVNAGRAESNGIFMDQGSSGFLVEDNHIHHIARSPMRFHQAGKNTLRNNKLEPGQDVPPLRFNNTPEANITVE
jgi:hypothetical protein